MRDTRDRKAEARGTDEAKADNFSGRRIGLKGWGVSFSEVHRLRRRRTGAM
jgi:hypothetical protein